MTSMIELVYTSFVCDGLKSLKMNYIFSHSHSHFPWYKLTEPWLFMLD